MVEVLVPMLFSFWMCVIYVIFSIIMIGIWICIGIMGGPLLYLKPPKAPPVPELPPLPEVPNLVSPQGKG